MNPFYKVRRKSAAVLGLVGVLVSPTCLANYACTGVVSYLGIDAGGTVMVAIGGTVTHGICNIDVQGTFNMKVASCKIAYASLLAAKVSGKTITTYYNPNGMGCTTLPSWGAVPSVYFVQGPD